VIAAVAAAAVLLVVGLIAWLSSEDASQIDQLAALARKEKKGRIRKPTPTSPVQTAPAEPVPKKPEANPEPVEERSQADATAEPEPDPATTPLKRAEPTSVELPVASLDKRTHDGSDRTLAVTLPKARRYALSLRGLRDREALDLDLVCRPAEPGDTLTIVRDLTRGSKAGSKVAPSNLARFSIEEGKLHFQWEQALRRSLVEPAALLRDCILVVQGGGVELNVALRRLNEDPRSLTVRDGPRQIQWKESRPQRKLVIRSCQVKTNQGWEEISESQEDRNKRVRFLVGTAADPPQTTLFLSVNLQDDARVWPTLNPSTQHISDELAELNKKKSALENAIQKIDKGLAEDEQKLSRLRTQGERARSLLQEARNAADPSLPFLGPNPVQTAFILNTEIELGIKMLNDQIVSMKLRIGQDEEQTKRLGGQISQQERLLKEARNFEKAPVRLQLGIVVDGEAMEVARIGNWTASGPDPK
jgi:hypothetical protein